MEIIALDAHKRYRQVCVQDKNGRMLYEKQINHGKGQIAQFLSEWTKGSAVALETVGNHKRFPFRHTSQLYRRIRERNGHAKAVGAVGRHLAEASFWVLTRNEDYKEPDIKSVSPTAV